MEEEAQRYLDSARQMSSAVNYAKAYELYLVAFEKNDEFRALYIDEFRKTLLSLNEVLVGDGKVEDIFHNFGRALSLYPNHFTFLNDIAKYLYKFGFYSEAWAHFQKSLISNEDFVDAEKNLNSIKNLLLERWHFRMLNDKMRNDAYYQAIKEYIVPFKDSVLDIGTGTGILAMFASDCAATAVTGIEASEHLSWVAECVTQGNNKHDIVIVNKMSTTMNYRDIGGKRTIVVTELFDASLLGEHVIQTISHAWEYFTIPTTRIIPNKAEFFVVAAKSELLINKYQLSNKAKELLNASNLNVHVICNDETYDCEDIHLCKDIEYMSAPQSLIKIDFNNYRDLQEKLRRTEPYGVKLTALKNGKVEMLVGWFNLYLTEDIRLTTNPCSDQRANAWQQAVFFDNIPKSVKENDVLNAKFLINNGKMTLVPDSAAPILRISKETLRFLNDNKYMQAITDCIGVATIYLEQITDISQINIIDLAPFPLFGMLMIKRGAQSLTCYANTDYDKKFFKKMFKSNDVSWTKVTVLDGKNWGTFSNQKFHAIFCNVLDICGDIDNVMYEKVRDIKTNNLVRGGLFLPSDISLVVQVVNSHWVDINNRVHDENVRGYKIADYINKYEVTQNFCINFSFLESMEVTEPLNLGSIFTESKIEEVSLPVIAKGRANAILCWYNIVLFKGMAEVTTKRDDCFIDGMLFLMQPKSDLLPKANIKLKHCVDPDGSFKLKFFTINT